jgi:hypothetical protein
LLQPEEQKLLLTVRAMAKPLRKRLVKGWVWQMEWHLRKELQRGLVLILQQVSPEPFSPELS